MKRNLKSSTGVRFAPQDTAGQRQGLVKVMSEGGNAKEFLGALELTNRDTSMMGLTLDEISAISNDPEEEEARVVQELDKHHLMAISGEFGRFIGQNNTQMLDFLTGMWDGDDYDYETQGKKIVLKHPLLNIIGCTTPVGIAQSLPASAGNQGFLSRFILVYGARKHKLVPRPSVPPASLVAAVQDSMAKVYYDFHGEFRETQEALAHSESLYERPLSITDSRFGYYAERRYTHLLKLAMCLCAARGGEMCIVKDDVVEADQILRATEKGMPDALGEFGMNPLAAVKQMILEKIRSASVIDLETLKMMFHRDARSQEITEVINDLNRLGQIRLIQGKSGRVNVHSAVKIENIEDSMLRTLSGDT